MKLKAVFLFFYILLTTGCAAHNMTWDAFEPDFIGQCKETAKESSNFNRYFDCLANNAGVIQFKQAEEIQTQGLVRVDLETCPHTVKLRGASEMLTVFGKKPDLQETITLIRPSFMLGAGGTWNIKPKKWDDMLVIPLYPFWRQSFTVSCE